MAGEFHLSGEVVLVKTENYYAHRSIISRAMLINQRYIWLHLVTSYAKKKALVIQTNDLTEPIRTTVLRGQFDDVRLVSCRQRWGATCTTWPLY